VHDIGKIAVSDKISFPARLIVLASP